MKPIAASVAQADDAAMMGGAAEGACNWRLPLRRLGGSAPQSTAIHAREEHRAGLSCTLAHPWAEFLVAGASPLRTQGDMLASADKAYTGVGMQLASIQQRAAEQLCCQLFI